MKPQHKQLLDLKYKGNKSPNYYKDLKRLESGEPLDYIIGWTEFLNCKIDLSQRPLVPRNETEFWVSKSICSCRPACRQGRPCACHLATGQAKDLKLQENTTTATSSPKILDLFSGSGCIGIALLKHLPNATVHFADNEDKCLKQIQINLDLNTIQPNQYQIIKSDIFSNITSNYNYIFANPPYVAEQTKQQKSSRTPIRDQKRIYTDQVLKYEPRQALLAGPEGLKYIRPFLEQAQQHLKPDGEVFMEFSPEQKKAINKILKNNNYTEWQFYKDQYKKTRWLREK